MKAKTIKAVIRKKVDEWLASLPEELRELVKNQVVVTGGCIASMLLREKVNDFDIYLRSRSATARLAQHYVRQFLGDSDYKKNANGIHCKIYVDESKEDRISIVVKSAGVADERAAEGKPYEYFEASEDGAAGQYVAEVMDDPGDIQDQLEATEKAVLEQQEDDKPRYRPVFLSTNAITLSQRIQIVTRFYGEPDEIHANYDFAHCMNYWTSWNNELMLRQPALEALLTKELRYVGSKYPLCSLIRIRKFTGRGWTINAGQILKAVIQLNEMDLANPAVLQEQLTGVDAAYFCELMAKVKAQDPEKINSAYLVEIVDRLF